MQKILIAAMTMALSITAQAQTQDWTENVVTTDPGARSSIMGTSDGSSLFFYGGAKPGGLFQSDLWSYDGVAWTLEAASGAGPSDRGNYQIAWDQARNVLVLFGGFDKTTGILMGDTWEWSSTGGWSQMLPAASPGIRKWGDMEYFPGVGVVLHGGKDTVSGTVYSDTWAWDGTSWNAMTSSPVQQQRGRMVYRPMHNDLLWFGGKNGTDTVMNETWSFDGIAWTEIPTTTTPGATTNGGLFAFGMYQDMNTNKTVLFGGTQTGGTQNKTWEFDGSDWAQVVPVTTPQDRTGCAISWIPGAGKALMYGGYSSKQLDDEWSRSAAVLGTFVNSGTGCSTSAGLVATVSSTAMPAIGSGLSLEFNNLTAGTLPYAMLGLSSTSWLGLPLPLPMGTFLPGSGPTCNILTSPDKFLPLFPTAGSATLNLPIPNDIVFIGLAIHAQAVQIEVVGGNVIAASSGLGSSLLGQL